MASTDPLPSIRTITSYRWPLSRTQNSSEMYQSPTPLDCRLSEVSSQWGQHDSEDYVHPHYKEEYRLAIYALVSGGREAYDNFLKSEQMGNFLSEQELRYILQNVKQMKFDLTEENSGIMSDTCSSDTYWPVESDLETPDLELGWPQGTPDVMGTDINLFFHPPRQNCPTIKEVIRKLIQEARQVIAIVMDVFTDVDIFKDIVEASLMGVAVYILLNDFHLTSFLSMAEQHDVHIQRLKKMRVRAVKGQEYLCRSGAMFHGTMEQKFMLVDCKTVVFGSYSFMWSYEKLHLSMVQVITGQLVRAFDEEFRVLFARSTVPDVLSEKCFQSLHSRHSQGACMASAFYIPHPSERRDQPAQILDRVYKRACGIQPSSNTCVLETEVKLRNKGPVDKTPTINHSETMQNQLYPLQGAATSSFLKRRSYGGGMRESTCIPDQLSKMNSVGNWNIVRDGGPHDSTGRSDYSCSPPQSVRLQNLYKKDRMKRQSYHGMDKELLSLRQNLPTWDNSSKSFLRLWRVESYLSNTDPHKADSSDTLSNGLHCRPNPYLSSRLRSSLVFKATIPEHPESHTNVTDSMSTGLQDDECSSSTSRPLYSPTLQYPVKHTHRSERQDHTLKRHSFHTLDKPTSSNDTGPTVDQHPAVYDTLDRTRWNQEDPTITRPSSISVSGSLESTEEQMSTRAEPTPLIQLQQNQRSASHCDIRDTERSDPCAFNWQEPLTRAVSTMNLWDTIKEPSLKSSNFESPFIEKEPKKIKTLLNIPERMNSPPPFETSSGVKSPGTTTPSNVDVKLSFEENYFADKTRQSLGPCFSTDRPQSQYDQNLTASDAATEKERPDSLQSDRLCSTTEVWHRNPTGENRVYSRFEPFCKFERKPSAVNQRESHRAFHPAHPPNSAINERPNFFAYRSQTRNDNKFGRFMQRVGNLIHKNK